MKTAILKQNKQRLAPGWAASTAAVSGGAARSAQPAGPQMKRRPCSLAFDEALGAYRWTFQEERSSR